MSDKCPHDMTFDNCDFCQETAANAACNPAGGIPVVHPFDQNDTQQSLPHPDTLGDAMRRNAATRWPDPIEQNKELLIKNVERRPQTIVELGALGVSRAQCQIWIEEAERQAAATGGLADKPNSDERNRR